MGSKRPATPAYRPPAASRSRVRAPRSISSVAMFPSWQAYSKIRYPSSRVNGIDTVQGRSKTAGSSTVISYMSVSAAVRVNRSTILSASLFGKPRSRPDPACGPEPASIMKVGGLDHEGFAVPAAT